MLEKFKYELRLILGEEIDPLSNLVHGTKLLDTKKRISKRVLSTLDALLEEKKSK